MTKLISVSDDVYFKLSRLKGNESFSVVLRGLLVKRNNRERILEFAGKGGFEDDKLRELKQGWKKWSEKSA